MSNISADYQPILNRAIAITSQMQAWINEAAELELKASLMPLTTQERKRLADLNSGIDTCEVCIEDGTALPNQPWITRALKPVTERIAIA
ncbi:MAG: hypothetical protein BGO25_18105 [Acidobacteriales bacterium 59-55]|nr:hypothetical protein [Terriglobales bacterium]OJV41589.1 MAG: hypothetical protein BGO25_18105 [Acidobacteriales bacterium 59-55]